VSVLNILVVDDSAILRGHIALLLRDNFEQVIVGEASSGDEAIVMFGQSVWDVVVLDISMPGISGMVVLDRLHEQAPGLPVVMLSTEAGAFAVDNCFARGALAYVAKENAPNELVPAIKSALQGQPYRCQRVRQAVSVLSNKPNVS
jgi:two-component system, NarL family, invasion response regulator UvrY